MIMVSHGTRSEGPSQVSSEILSSFRLHTYSGKTELQKKKMYVRSKTATVD